MTLRAQRHDAGDARVILVILRPVDWRSAPFAKLQALPKDAKPVTSWPDRDEAFTDVALGIRQVAPNFKTTRASGLIGFTTNRPTAPCIGVRHEKNSMYS